MSLPRKINKEATRTLNLILRGFGISSEFPVYVTDTVRGRCDYTNKNLTVPLWAFNDARPGYKVYYACHEMAHVVTPVVKGDVHGAAFQANFKKICPKEYWHFELNYKPKLAAAAGIRSPE